MYHLENLLGTDDVIDVRVAITIVKQRFERVERLFSSVSRARRCFRSNGHRRNEAIAKKYLKKAP